jgi:ubiquinone/menaquinone biosynthesis C-methylase UbiE
MCRRRLAFVHHENVDRPRRLDEVERTLRPDGRVVVIEWKKQDEQHGRAKKEGRLGEEEADSFQALEHHICRIPLNAERDTNNAHLRLSVLRLREEL